MHLQVEAGGLGTRGPPQPNDKDQPELKALSQTNTILNCYLVKGHIHLSMNKESFVF